MTEQVIITLSSCPDEATAQRLASALVQERPAACVHRPSGARRYCGDLRLERVANPATGGNEQYLEWVRSGVAVTQRTEAT